MRRRAETTYDSGDFTAILNKATHVADWAGFDTRKTETRARGKLRGHGIGNYLEVTAPPMNEMGGLRFDGRRHRHDHHRHARLRPGPRRAVRASPDREARRPRSSASACCRATATN
ncbi:MAG: hypothetical protein WDO24_05850 [Pseudomonadota bacterium]